MSPGERLILEELRSFGQRLEAIEQRLDALDRVGIIEANTVNSMSGIGQLQTALTSLRTELMRERRPSGMIPAVVPPKDKP